MLAILKVTTMVAAVGAVACGATTRGAAPVQSTPPATSTAAQTTGPTQVSSDERGRIPAGQEFDVRLQSSLNSGRATVEQRFEATTVVDIMQDGRVLVPAGSVVRGVVSDVKPAGRVDRTGSLTLSFDSITVNERRYPIRALATQVFESNIREEAGTAGVGAGVGGVVGGLLGGLRGAILGAVIGAGGAIAATEGTDVDLPAGSIIRIRLDSDLQVR